MIDQNMKSIKIYTATKGKKEDTPLYRSLSKKGLGLVDGVLHPEHYEENNTKSLQKCYNSFLEHARSNDIDIAVFIHDDVFINTCDLRTRVVNASEEFTVFGLAGATTCKVGNPALWHLMSEKKDQRGCVAHGTESIYQYTSFGPIPSRCLLIDGVFIGIDIKTFPDTIKFDESYPSKFHYYDLDFCLECNKKGVIMGVVDIPIIHMSPGLTNPNNEFYKGQEYFINKWKK